MRKIIFLLLFTFLFSPMPIAAETADEEIGTAVMGSDDIAEEDAANEKEKKGNAYGRGQEKGEMTRGNRISNAVQEMLKVADRNGGIGQQVRAIARNQNRIQEEIDNDIEELKKRNRMLKFLIGPNYDKIEAVEEKMIDRKRQLETLEEISADLEPAEADIIKAQIEEFNQIRAQIAQELHRAGQGFSLFGWVKKLRK